MDNDETTEPFPSMDEPQQNNQGDSLIRATKEKKPIPEIDFTIHTMEDGTQVNTQERVCKGTCHPHPHLQPPSRRRHKTTNSPPTSFVTEQCFVSCSLQCHPAVCWQFFQDVMA